MPQSLIKLRICAGNSLFRDMRVKLKNIEVYIFGIPSSKQIVKSGLSASESSGYGIYFIGALGCIRSILLLISSFVRQLR